MAQYKTDELKYYSNLMKPKINKTLLSLKNFYTFRFNLLLFDATVTTLTLPTDLIKEIKSINPKIKAIFTIRNPIDRSFSEAKMFYYYKKYKDIIIKDVTKDFNSIEKYLQSEYSKKCSSYSRHLPRWEKVLGKDNIMYINFNDIKNNPSEVFKNVILFTGGKYNKNILKKLNINKKVNDSKLENQLKKNIDMPKNIHDLLSQLYKNEIVWLNNKFGFNFK